MSLTGVIQEDVAAGMWRGPARHLMPDNAVFEATNAFVNNDGLARRRGGSQLYSTADFGADGLLFGWAGYLGPGYREVIASENDFAVLDDDKTVINLGGAGVSGPSTACEIGGILFINGDVMYGGSRLSAAYSTGTVAVTVDSKAVVGTGTNWDPNVDAGMLFQIAGERAYVVESVEDDTHLTLADPYEGATGAGNAYACSPILTVAAPYIAGDFAFVAGNRLCVCTDNRMDFSDYGNPHSYNTEENNWLFPEGSKLLGGAGGETRAYIFTTSGMWEIRNFDYEIVDLAGNNQQTLNRINAELILWGQAGIATWRDAVVIPTFDGIWLYDGSGFEQLSRSIAGAWRDFARFGFNPGQAAVFEAHYFLPIVNNQDEVQDLLVCRLDRPVPTDIGKVFPWTRFEGEGANVEGFALGFSEAEGRPKLLGFSRAAASRVLDCSDYFNPGVSVATDHDDTPHRFVVTYRDISTGSGKWRGSRTTENVVNRIRINYEAVRSNTTTHTVAADFSNGALNGEGSFWGSSYWGSAYWSGEIEQEFESMPGLGNQSDGRRSKVWVPNASQKRCSLARVRVRSTSPWADLKLKSMEMIIKQGKRI